MSILARAESHLSNEAFVNLTCWFENYPALCDEIEAFLKNEDWEEIEDAFYTHIQVGTGGIRGRMGMGPNRINERTIGEAAQGLSEFIKGFGKATMQKSVVVGYEARKHSKEFALLSCRIFAANGMRTYLFEDIRSTPELSFAVRHLKATAGVQITASHNPSTDNGFKFYWTDGGQVVPPLDAYFMELVAHVTTIKMMGEGAARAKGLIVTIGKEIDAAYLGRIGQISLVPSRSARIVFSPLHGAGSTSILPVLRKNGFEIHIVKKQAEPDENFPTAKGNLINPEYPEVTVLSLQLANRLGLDISLTSDPDADRVAVGAKVGLASHELRCLNGNEVGAFLTHFILERLKERGELHKDKVVITTYVTTSLISDIAKSFDVRIVSDLLVGFKFIAQTIENLKDHKDFVFAAEESLGYLYGDFVRDKDGAIASFLVAQAASWLKDQDKTLFQYLDAIYQRYGYYCNTWVAVEMSGKGGFLQKKAIMQYLRSHPPRTLGGFQVVSIRDELPEKDRTPEAYKVGAGPDQLTFILSDDERTRVTVRPSGTEPKLKYYIQHYAKTQTNLAKTKKTVDETANDLQRDILSYTKERAQL